MSLDEKRVQMVSHIDHMEADVTDDKGQVDHIDSEVAKVIASERTQSYRDVWRTHKRAFLWSVGVSWVCRRWIRLTHVRTTHC
jgi:hypothetical protein